MLHQIKEKNFCNKSNSSAQSMFEIVLTLAMFVSRMKNKLIYIAEFITRRKKKLNSTSAEKQSSLFFFSLLKIFFLEHYLYCACQK